MNWNQEQYQQLTEHYRDLPDEALLALAEAPENLTEIAEEVLNKELATRKLTLVDHPPTESPSPVALGRRTEDNAAEWFEYANNAPTDCTFWFQYLYQANDACAILGEAAIDSQILAGPPPLVVVRAQDLEQACRLLDRPIPDPTPIDPNLEGVEFTTPACPACGTPDPALINVDPTNRWLCESCDHEWDDQA